MTADISERWSDFVGQVNNVLRYFKKQRLDVKYEYKLFQAFTSFFGSDLRNLSCNELGAHTGDL